MFAFGDSSSVDKRAVACAVAAGLATYKALMVHRARSYVPPGAKRVPNPSTLFGTIFGHMPDPKDEGGKILENIGEYYDDAPVVQFTMTTEGRLLLLTPEDNDYVMNKTHIYSKGWMYKALLGGVLGEGLLNIQDEELHGFHRKSINPAFGPAALDNMANNVFTRLVDENMKALAATLRDAGDSDVPHPADLTQLFNEATLRIVEETAFRPNSVGTHSDGTSLATLATSMLGKIMIKWHMFLPFGDWLPTPSARFLKSGRQELVSKISALAGKCRGNPPPKKEWVLFDYLVGITDISDSVLVDHSLTFLFAGHETTATAMSWVVYHLAANPEVQAKLFEELSGCMALDSMPPVGVLRDCQYLTAVINETLRLFPPAIGVGRVVQQDDVLPSGVCANKGNVVLIGVINLHRSKRIWGEDAKEWNPDRWLRELTEAQRMGFIPFLSGKRNCIGREFAMNEMRMLIASLIRRYELSWPKDEPKPVARVALTLRPRTNVVPLVVQRKE